MTKAIKINRHERQQGWSNVRIAIPEEEEPKTEAKENSNAELKLQMKKTKKHVSEKLDSEGIILRHLLVKLVN